MEPIIPSNLGAKSAALRSKLHDIAFYLDGIDSGDIELDPEIYDGIYSGIHTLTPPLPARPARPPVGIIIKDATVKPEPVPGRIRSITEITSSGGGQPLCPWCFKPLLISQGRLP